MSESDQLPRDCAERDFPLVSVIIASYNHAPYIEASIRSVMGQTYSNFELLVVDDGSSDDSVERITRLQAEYGFDFQTQQNCGLSRTLNAAIARSKGSLIVPFGSDDIMRPQRLAVQVDYMQGKPEVGICSANIDIIDASGMPLPDREQKQRHLPFRRLDFDDHFLDLKPGPQAATLMFRREALGAVGGFNPDIRLEDVYICLSILKAGYVIDILPDVLADYRKHESNTYKHLRFMAENMQKTYALFSDHPAYADVRLKYMISMFLKASSRDKVLARELLSELPVHKWNAKVIRGIWRLLFSQLTPRFARQISQVGLSRMWCESLFKGYVRYWLPTALVLLLTGMFWVGERSLYHKLYYLSFALPTLIVALVCWRRFLFLRQAPLFWLFVTFAAYVALSLAWYSGSVDYSKLKHPLYICMLLLGVAALGDVDMRRLVLAVGVGGGVAALAALVSIVIFLGENREYARLEGYGALYNPLLTSHVYGFFAALWLGALMSSARRWPLKLMMLAPLVLLLFLTGSRTPFMGLFACFVWLLIMVADRRGLWLMLALAGIGATGVWFFGADLLERGVSYRPFIWAETWKQIMPALWFGHGYGTGIDIVLPDGANTLLADPHNLTLGVIYQTGLVGGVLWLALYLYSLLSAWRMRGSGLVLISSTLLVYGFVAGMTEGGSFMSRPKEHWFLIWIPIAIHLAVLCKVSKARKAAVATPGSTSGAQGARTFSHRALNGNSAIRSLCSRQRSK